MNTTKNLPPLPESLKYPGCIGAPRGDGSRDRESNAHIKPGCYTILLDRFLSTHELSRFRGTFRVRIEDAHITGSGDLYREPNLEKAGYSPGYSVHSEIPAFPIAYYYAYLVLTGIGAVNGNQEEIELRLNVYAFNSRDRSWAPPHPVVIKVKNFFTPDSTFSLSGHLYSTSGVVLGQISLSWVSQYLRSAAIEIDRVKAETEWPMDNRGSDTWREEYSQPDDVTETWQSVFGKAGWKITVIQSDTIASEEKSKEVWCTGDLHRYLTKDKCRDSDNLDIQWRYLLFAVPKILGDYKGLRCGDGLDNFSTHPRQVAVVASHYKFENDKYRKANGWPLCETPDYFHTALHEIGHLMMLRHPDDPGDKHLMQQTEYFTWEHDVEKIPFPQNIRWTFSPINLERLRHMPDIAVRPGALPAGIDLPLPAPLAYSNVYENIVKMEVAVLSEKVPFGAPVRVNYSLQNISNNPVYLPAHIGIKTGFVRASVTGPMDHSGEVVTLLTSLGDVKLKEIKQGEYLKHSITLLRGNQEALFPYSDYYKLEIQISWTGPLGRLRLSGATWVEVQPPETEGQKKIAQEIISTPETLPSLAISGDHLKIGNSVFDEACKNDILKPHYAVTLAKRWGRLSGDRASNLREAIRYLKKSTVISPAELKSIIRMVKKALDDINEELLDKFKKFLLYKYDQLPQMPPPPTSRTKDPSTVKPPPPAPNIPDPEILEEIKALTKKK